MDKANKQTTKYEYTVDHDISSRPASSEMVSCCAECKSVRVCTITGDSWSKGADFSEDHNVEMVMEL